MQQQAISIDPVCGMEVERAVLVAFLAIGGFFLFTEHRAHVRRPGA